MIKYIVFFLMGLLSLSCTREKKGGDSFTYSMDMRGKQLRPELSSPQALRQFMQQNGYTLVDKTQAGARVFYSASYGVDAKEGASGAEAGQAFGSLVKTPDGIFFSQEDKVTLQSLLPPGSETQFGQGLSRWKFDGRDGYGQLLIDVATNQRARSKQALHTGYSSMEVAIVSFEGGTAGGQVSYSDVIEVSLKGGQSQTEIYLGRNGPVAMESRFNDMPSGTAKVYIMGDGSSIPRQ